MVMPGDNVTCTFDLLSPGGCPSLLPLAGPPPLRRLHDDASHTTPEPLHLTAPWLLCAAPGHPALCPVLPQSPWSPACALPFARAAAPWAPAWWERSSNDVCGCF